MKTFKQFITEKIYDYEVEGFMKKKPEVANRIIKHVRDAHKDGKTVGFRSDPTSVGSKEITHKSSIWSRNPTTQGLAGQGHIQGEEHADGVHYTPVHPEHTDHEIIRRALTHNRYKTSNLGKVENNFHVVAGKHDDEASKELQKRRTQGLHPNDAKDEIETYPEGILKNNSIKHSVSHNDMWK